LESASDGAVPSTMDPAEVGTTSDPEVDPPLESEAPAAAGGEGLSIGIADEEAAEKEEEEEDDEDCGKSLQRDSSAPCSASLDWRSVSLTERLERATAAPETAPG
jgi:hypothetical protein